MKAADRAWRDDMADEDLAQAAQEGQECFLILYDRHIERVQCYVYAHVAELSEVDDLVSTIFLRALAKLDTYRRDRGTFAAWLFGIARNAIADHRRKLPRRALSLAEAGDRQEERPGPEEAILVRERHEAMRRAFGALTADQRDALALRYLADLPFADVGRTLRKSEPAAKMLVHRGLEALRRALGEEEQQ